MAEGVVGKSSTTTALDWVKNINSFTRKLERYCHDVYCYWVYLKC